MACHRQTNPKKRQQQYKYLKTNKNFTVNLNMYLLYLLYLFILFICQHHQKANFSD